MGRLGLRRNTPATVITSLVGSSETAVSSPCQAFDVHRLQCHENIIKMGSEIRRSRLFRLDVSEGDRPRASARAVRTESSQSKLLLQRLTDPR